MDLPKWAMQDPSIVYDRLESMDDMAESRQQKARTELESLFGDNVTAYQEPLFAHAHGAVVFALNYNHQQYDRPLINQLAGKTVPAGKGLSGLDGAAQAGMIRSILGQLSDHECALVLAYCTPKRLPVSGGPGDKIVIENKAVRITRWSVNPEYQAAIHEVANSFEIRQLASSNHISIRAVRLACVARCFGDRIHLGEVAERAKLSYRTIKRQHQAVREYLLGARGRDGEHASLGAIQQAMNRLEGALREHGIID